MQQLPKGKLAVLFGFIVFLNLFLFHAVGSVALALLLTGGFVFVWLIFTQASNKIKQLKTLLPAGALFMLLQILITQRAYWFSQFILVVSSLVLLTILTYLLASRIRFMRSLLETVLIPFHLGISYMNSFFTLLINLLSQKHFLSGPLASSSKTKSIIIGLVLGIPVVITLITLLSGADPIYANFIKKVFYIDIKLPEKLTFRIMFSIFWLVFLSPLLILKRNSDFKSPLNSLKQVLLTREMTIVMSLVALVLGSFLLVQAPYIFVNVAAETDLTKYGVATYSEYVTKGFGEFLFVSVFIYFLIWLGLVFMRGKNKLEKGLLFHVQLVVLGEFSIFLFSIFRRVWLYQTLHGWSLIRIYGSLFLLWITFITVTLALRHLREKKYVIAEVGFTLLMVLFVGFFNAERFIASVHPPTVNKRIDYVYLSRMSSDGYNGWKMAYEYVQGTLVNRDLQNRDLINRDERRDIAYAGVIINHLIFHYHMLVHQYGTPQELREYNMSILNSVETLANDTLSVLETETDSQINKDITNALSQLRNQRLSLASNPNPDKKRYVQVYVDTLPDNFNSSNPTTCSFSGGMYCNRFYNWNGDIQIKSKDQLGDLDNIFIWNGSEARVYQDMKIKLPYTELLYLEKIYFDLSRKISSQPAEERDYDIDISFSTPFL